jgi:hypothetical protein
MNRTLKNRPRCVTSNIGDIRRWFEDFKRDLRELHEGQKGVYVVTYVDKRPPTVYVDVKEILGE